jgi:fatty-acyl-CoA synthase
VKAFPSGGCFGDLILDAIARHGGRLAVVDGDRRLTYRELGARIARALAILETLGLGPGDTVAQLSANSSDLWAVMAAAYIGGYRSVTLHPFGGRDDQAFILADCGAKLLIANAAHAGRAASLVCDGLAVLGHEAGGALAGFWDVPAAETALPRVASGAAEDIVRIAYTGGTTGRAKGVLLSNRAMTANATMALAAIPFPSAPRFLCPAPVSHGAGSIVVPTLSLGGTVILQRGFDPALFCAAAAAFDANLTWLVPTMITALLDSPAAGFPASFETVIWSGAPMTPDRVRQAIDRFGPVLVQCYGQSEAPNTIMLLTGEEQARHPAAVGRPFPGIAVALLDDDGEPVAAGQPGEICVRGPLVMSGYLNMAEATATAFAGGWLHTGDVGVVDPDGLYRIVDRKKDMIITGGFNVYPREIEDVIAAQKGVAAVAVIGVPDAHWGEAVTAIVVPRAGGAPDPEMLIAAVRAAKGPIHVPKAFDFVDALPLTPLGKPDKRALRARYAAD